MNWESCVDSVTKVPTLRCIPVVINNVVYAAIALSGIAATILIILSGIRLLTSGGDQIKVQQAKKTMTYAVIGLVLVLLSYFIVNVLARVTGAGIS